MKSLLNYIIRSRDKEPEYYLVGDIIEETPMNDIWHYKVTKVTTSMVTVDTYTSESKTKRHTSHDIYLPWEYARLIDADTDLYK